MRSAVIGLLVGEAERAGAPRGASGRRAFRPRAVARGGTEASPRSRRRGCAAIPVGYSQLRVAADCADSVEVRCAVRLCVRSCVGMQRDRSSAWIGSAPADVPCVCVCVRACVCVCVYIHIHMYTLHLQMFLEHFVAFLSKSTERFFSARMMSGTSTARPDASTPFTNVT